MEQLIAEITQRTGISDQQAREAVNTVLTFLKGRLPAPVAAQVDGLLSGQTAGGVAGQAQAALGGLGDMFNKK